MRRFRIELVVEGGSDRADVTGDEFDEAALLLRRLARTGKLLNFGALADVEVEVRARALDGSLATAMERRAR